MESQNNDETKGDTQFELNKLSYLSDNNKEHNNTVEFHTKPNERDRILRDGSSNQGKLSFISRKV